MYRWYIDENGILRAKDAAGNVTNPVPALDPAAPLNLLGMPGEPAPVSGQLRLFAKERAGRLLPACVGPGGVATRLQPHLGANRLGLWMPNGANTATVTTLGSAWVAPSITAVPMADTPVGRIRKANAATAATAGTVIQLATELAYSLNTGFHFTANFQPFAAGNVASRRVFCGLSAVAVTNVALSSLALIGIHADVGQNNFQARGVNGVETDLGASFPANSDNDWYRFEMYCVPGGSAVGWNLHNLISGEITGGTFSGVQLPLAGTFMATRTALVTTAAAAQHYRLGHHMVETDL
jgi:hypothetical protein